jgi:hypothetical protein
MLISPPHPVREIDPAMVEEVAHDMNINGDYFEINNLNRNGHAIQAATWKGTRTGKQIPQLASIMNGSSNNGNRQFGGLSQMLNGGRGQDDHVTDFILNKTLRVEDVLGPLQLAHPRHGLQLLGECMFILRPIIYSKLLLMIMICI